MEKFLNLRIEKEIMEEINQTAKEDYRKQQDQIRFLLALGLKEREKMRVNK